MLSIHEIPSPATGKDTMPVELNRMSLATRCPSKPLVLAGLTLALLGCSQVDDATAPSIDASPASASVDEYVAVDLGTLFGTFSEATAINPRGQVVGNSGHAFLWENGVMTDLGSLEVGRSSFATDINPAGQVVGSSQTSDPRTDGCCHAFIWENGVMTFLGTLGGASSNANAINPSGQVAGYSDTENGEQHAFLWDRGVMTDLGTLGGTISIANDISPSGVVSGYSFTSNGASHAFRWEKGIMTDLGPDGSFSIAYGINPRGQIVGGDVLWDKGIITHLGEIEAHDINPSAQVVGFHFSQAAQDYRALLWSDGVLRDLGTLGGSGAMAFGLNAAGQVVGRSRTASGDIHATLWTRK
jgi:probable HAF family extracellular repeat protein